MAKIGVVCTLALITLFLFAGCTRINYDNDHFRDYRVFLNYAFGDFQLVEERRGSDLQGEPQFGMRWHRYRIWEIAYTQPDGEAGTFIFNNRTAMRTQVRVAAFEIANADMADVIANYLNSFVITGSNTGVVQGAIFRAARVTLDFDFVDINDVNILCSKAGLQLGTATTQSLMADWGLGLNRITVRQMQTPSVVRVRNLMDMVGALSVYAAQEGVIDLLLEIRADDAVNSIVIHGRYIECRESQSTLDIRYDPQRNVFVIDEVRGRTNLARGYANASRDFLAIVRMLAEWTAQDKISVDFRFTFGADVMETLSVDWAWFHAIEYFCVQTDAFMGEFEEDTPINSRRRWLYENFN